MTNKTKSLNGLSLDELLDLRDSVDTQLKTLAKSELEEMERRMERLSEIAKASGETKTGKKRGRPAGVKKAKTRTSKLKGAKVAPKFKHPETGLTWSGRGMTPVWLREHEAKGGKRDDFAV